jgi:anaerobic selenocysteine-containing dehydrogenase
MLIESQWGKVKCMARHSEAVDPGTVWTWNAIGKAESAWNLDANADESKKGFLLNHLITEELPFGQFRVSNSDPITGQAGWYDVRVKISPADKEAHEETLPQFKAYSVPGMIIKK